MKKYNILMRTKIYLSYFIKKMKIEKYIFHMYEHIK